MECTGAACDMAGIGAGAVTGVVQNNGSIGKSGRDERNTERVFRLGGQRRLACKLVPLMMVRGVPDNSCMNVADSQETARLSYIAVTILAKGRDR